MRLAYPLLLLVPALAGCAASQHCERNEQVYASAVEQAPLQSPEGLQVPPPDPNFAIPSATGEDVKYAQAGGGRKSPCLDAPPPLPSTASPAPEPERDPGFETEPLSEESPADTESVPAGP
jgi:uncharacterized lipoprotein